MGYEEIPEHVREELRRVSLNARAGFELNEADMAATLRLLAKLWSDRHPGELLDLGRLIHAVTFAWEHREDRRFGYFLCELEGLVVQYGIPTGQEPSADGKEDTAARDDGTSR
jgi:hypothetical protein